MSESESVVVQTGQVLTRTATAGELTVLRTSIVWVVISAVVGLWLLVTATPKTASAAPAEMDRNRYFKLKDNI
jgi:hypothetical protein